MKIMWFTSGAVIGLTTMSIALGSVPTHSRITDDTAIYQKLSDIRVAKQGNIDFDKDIAQLSSKEKRYQEDLPRWQAPAKRISQQKYHFTGTATTAASASAAKRD